MTKEEIKAKIAELQSQLAGMESENEETTETEAKPKSRTVKVPDAFSVGGHTDVEIPDYTPEENTEAAEEEPAEAPKTEEEPAAEEETKKETSEQ
jgi:hypothetical protein